MSIEVRSDCFFYDEKHLKETLPGIGVEREWTYRNCRILHRLYCAFEECTFYKTQKKLDDEKMQCQRRLKDIGRDKEMIEKYGGK